MTSKYDPTRPTVGKLYRDLQTMGSKTPIECGDMSNEQMKHWIDDLNDALLTDNFNGKPFYVLIHQKKDLQMPSSQLRKVHVMEFRPWPEDDTDCFWKDPKSLEVRFCWSLPHTSEMDNVLLNPHLFAPEMVFQVKAWKAFDMRQFGFYEHPELKWIPNPDWKDRTIVKPLGLV